MLWQENKEAVRLKIMLKQAANQKAVKEKAAVEAAVAVLKRQAKAANHTAGNTCLK
jgi:hypothetical protein